MHVIIPLYAHHSSDQWVKLLREDIGQTVVVMNPNDGWRGLKLKDTQGWQVLYRQLAARGVQVLPYIDLCHAEGDGKGGWTLRKKKLEDIRLECGIAKATCDSQRVRFFLDDYTPLNMFREVVDWVKKMSAEPGLYCRHVVNPGTMRAIPPGLVGMTHEKKGYPEQPGRHRAWIAYASKWDPMCSGVTGLRRGDLFYVHQMPEQAETSPLLTLSDSLVAQLEHARVRRSKA